KPARRASGSRERGNSRRWREATAGPRTSAADGAARGGARPRAARRHAPAAARRPRATGRACRSRAADLAEQALGPDQQYRQRQRIDEERAELRQQVLERGIGDAEQERGKERPADGAEP